MSQTIQLSRTARVPDPVRVARAERAPELGPRILFLSGGSALKATSAALKRLTHNSIHLITPFDSGGSSRQLRAAFEMISIGDLRNRLLALADESVRGNPETYALMAYRLSEQAEQDELRRELQTLLSGEHRLIAQVPDPLRRLIQNPLGKLLAALPASFDLRGANLGNLVLAGGYLEHDGEIQSVLFLFSRLLESRGIVHPTSLFPAQLCLELESGKRLLGQHLFAAPGAIDAPARRLTLARNLNDPTPMAVPASDKALKWIRRADLIAYPMGSFYSSVLCNLLPQGVGRALVAAKNPKVYIPNLGVDPEEYGLSLSKKVDSLLAQVKLDAPAAQLSDVLNLVLIDATWATQGPAAPVLSEELQALRARGVSVLTLPLCAPAPSAQEPRIDATLLSEALISLC